MKQIHVQLGQDKINCQAGISLLELSREMQRPGASPIMMAMVNGKLRELPFQLDEDCSVEFIDMEHPDGYRVYRRTVYYLFIRSAHEVLGRQIQIKIRHSISHGSYCEIWRRKEEERADSGPWITEKEVADIRSRMWEIVQNNEPIIKKVYPLEEAMDLFEAAGMDAKARLFRYRRFSTVNLYEFGHDKDYFYGFMLPESGSIQFFDLIAYKEGVILLMPEKEYPHRVPAFAPSEKLFQVFQQSKEWSRILEVEDVGALNDSIAKGTIQELIHVSEALHAKRIANIAEEIKRRSDRIKLVLIAGPSSSGKTTFARKLSIQLRAEGMRPHMISVDNYFVDRDKTPLDQDGKPDFESLEAIDTKQFNEDIVRLMNGETVGIPYYNFKTGKRDERSNVFSMGPRDILVVEGIHGLNEKLSEMIPRDSKFKIYISALTLINIDDHNRIPTTDGRLLRRMVRDNLYRGTSAATTISMWPSVRRGEESNIFPFQEEADVMFNSAHIYELAVLKQYAEPLLFDIGRYEPEYGEARRLIKFLDYFLGVSSEMVPNNSIIREFIGGSVYEI